MSISPGLTATSDETATSATIRTSDISVADDDLRESLRQPGSTGSIHSWELVTAVDGPGSRLTVFLAGCPLRCLYCHNPDTWQMRRGERHTVEQVMAKVRRYEPVLRATGGGVTLSGGEPLLQAPFVENIFAECKKLGIHTALDTSGFLGGRASNGLLSNTDLVLLDVKSGLPDVYRKATSRPLQPTLDFGRRLAAQDKRVWVRFVLVPGLTDGEDNVESVAAYVASLGNVERVEVLPFHQMGKDKWAELDEAYALADTEPPTEELLVRVRAQFEQHGLTVF